MHLSVLKNELLPKSFNFCQATGVALLIKERKMTMCHSTYSIVPSRGAGVITTEMKGKCKFFALEVFLPTSQF